MPEVNAKRHAHNFQDLTGQVFGRWIVICIHIIRKGHVFWLCRCECGTERAVYAGRLRNGTSKSCGCLAREGTGMRSKTHGQTGSAEYVAWVHMKSRCYNRKNIRYKLYGGQGVSVCERWLNSFENFYADMGPRPSVDHSLDRFPNKNGNYEPGNVRWATEGEQQNNRTNNKNIMHDGVCLSLTAWARRVGMSYWTLRQRMRAGWSFERAISEPVH